MSHDIVKRGILSTRAYGGQYITPHSIKPGLFPTQIIAYFLFICTDQFKLRSTLIFQRHS